MESFGNDPGEWWDSLDAAFDRSLDSALERGGPLGLLFSGGVDSSLLAYELGRRGAEVTLYTVGRPGTHDLVVGEKAATRLRLPWVAIFVDEVRVERARAQFARDLEGLSFVPLSVQLSLAIAISQAAPCRLVCGQGADELFLGYAHFGRLLPPQAEQRSVEDLERLHEVDWPITRSVAAACGKEIVAPYLDPRFERAARRIPIQRRMPDDQPKALFRDWARHRGLPEDLAGRPKKAVQYGSGVANLLRRGRVPSG